MPDEALEALRARVMADAALQDRLAQCVELADFAARAAGEAAALGIAIEAAAIAAAAPADPAGARLHMPGSANITQWPPRHWLPVHISRASPTVDWAHFGSAPFTEALDQPAVRAALDRPLNRFLWPRMKLGDFVAGAPRDFAPSGFIFHMSRCGSTLAARMLGALASSVMVSEADAVNDAILIAHLAQNIEDNARVALVRSIVTAYGRRAAWGTFVRFEAWHALALPLIRRTFPDTPFVFLHRDPVEVLVSHQRLGGRDLVSGPMAKIWNIEGHERMDEDELTARALGKICANAADALAQGGGLAIDYRDLPGAVEAQILPHFAISVDSSVREAMDRMAQIDARAPEKKFASDADEKQHEASDALRALAAEHIGEAYRRLESLTPRRSRH
jgi:hypothetical protein